MKLGGRVRFNFTTGQFEERNLAPEALAVMGEDRSYTWQELSQRVDEFAEWLESKTPPQAPILLFGHKQADFVAGILAALKTRRPFVPVDSHFPAGRIQKYFSMTQALALLNFTDRVLTDFAGLQWCVPQAQEEGEVNAASIDLLEWKNVAYLMLTSGSSGGPKGVKVSRHNLADFADWVQQTWSGSRRFINQVLFSFDVSLYELTGALQQGGCVLLNSRSTTQLPQRFIERLKEGAGEVLVLTPSFAEMLLLDPGFSSQNLPQLQTFIFCGEVLALSSVKKLFERFPEARAWNTYGPTETTVAVSSFEVTAESLNRYKQIPIGRARPQTVLQIKDPQRDEDLQKTVGELHVGGTSVSLGYLANARGNEDFYMDDGVRWYATGDFVYEDDGLLFFVGRKDAQIKRAGFRVHLQEVEGFIASDRAVLQVAVVPVFKGPRVQRLLAFVQLTADNEDEALASLKSRLEKELPWYSCPDEWVITDRFPLNQSGKLDQEALKKLWLAKS